MNTIKEVRVGWAGTEYAVIEREDDSRHYSYLSNASISRLQQSINRGIRKGSCIAHPRHGCVMGWIARRKGE